MIDVLTTRDQNTSSDEVDRPAWIPFNIVADWNPCPYAYQTEEELMSHGPLHDDLMTLISSVLPLHLSKFGLKLWKDLFLLYRDDSGLKCRTGPDMLLASIDQELTAGAWDLDSLPVPEFVGEITSPESVFQDLEIKRHLYRSPWCPTIYGNRRPRRTGKSIR